MRPDEPPRKQLHRHGQRLELDIEHFRGRALQDALTEATAAYWERRAQAFEAAAPRPGDFAGRATATDIAEAITRCRGTARACRRHADLLRAGHPEDISPEVRAALREVA